MAPVAEGIREMSVPPPALADLERLVTAVMTARRALWRTLCAEPHPIDEQDHFHLGEGEFADWRQALPEPLEVVPLLHRGWLVYRNRRWSVDARTLETHQWLRCFLEPLLPGNDRRNARRKTRADVVSLVYRDIKRTHGVAGDPAVFHAFRLLAEGLARVTSPRRNHPLDPCDSELRDALRRSISSADSTVSSKATAYVELFFDVCFSL